MIKLDENFSLVPTAECWELQFRKELGINAKTGKVKVSQWKTYHTTINQALNSYVSEVSKPCAEISELISKLDEIKTLIKTIKNEKNKPTPETADLP